MQELHESRKSAKYLAETDFHDNPKTARWIIDNTDAIAKAYVAALVATFNIARKDTSVKPNPP